MHEVPLHRARRPQKHHFKPNMEPPSNLDGRVPPDPPDSHPSSSPGLLATPIAGGLNAKPTHGDSNPDTTPTLQQGPPPPLPTPGTGNGHEPPGDGGGNDTPISPTPGSGNTDIPNPNTSSDAPTPTPTPDPPDPNLQNPPPPPPQSDEGSQNSPVHLPEPKSQNPNPGDPSRGSGGPGKAVSTTTSSAKTKDTRVPYPGNGAPNSTGGGGDGPSNGGGDGSSAGANPSGGRDFGPGMIAAIAIGAALALGLLVYFLRKRAEKRRTAQHTPRLSSGENGRRDTFRSSFGDLRASTFDYHSDHSHENPNSNRYSGPFSDTMAVSLPAPQMTNVAYTDIAPPAIVVHSTGKSSGSSKFSIRSAGSGGTDSSDGQWLQIYPGEQHRDDGRLSPTDQRHPPSHARPFTPPESWSFSKPPGLRAESLAYSDESDAFSSPNPFADPDSQLSPTGFSSVEVVTRTFESRVVDDLAAEIGDEVSVLRVFDDGWARVKVLRRSGGPVRGLEGLIPIDCLRPKENGGPLFVDANPQRTRQVNV